MNGVDPAFVVVCATVREVVPVHHGDDRMPKSHGGDGLRKMFGFLVVKGWGSFDGAHRTKTATSGAFLAGDHERSVPAGPTLVDVRTPCFLAYGVESVVLDR